MSQGQNVPLPQVEKACETLLNELRAIWDDVGETDFDRDKLLLDIKNECLQLYRRHVDEANQSKAQLLQTISDSKAELAAIYSAMADWPEQAVQNAGSLKEELVRILPQLQEMRSRKLERISQFREVLQDMQKILNEIYGSADHNVFLDESDLSLRKLEELQSQLHDYEKLKSDRLKQVQQYLDDLNSLCLVLGMDFKQTAFEVHPSFGDSGGSRDIRNETIQHLATAIHKLQEIKTQRMQKLQNFATSMLKLWNLMGTPIHEQQGYLNVISNICSLEHEITEPNILSLDLIQNVEAEVLRLEELNSSKMKESFTMKSELDADTKMEAMESGINFDAMLPLLLFGTLSFKEHYDDREAVRGNFRSCWDSAFKKRRLYKILSRKTRSDKEILQEIHSFISLRGKRKYVLQFHRAIFEEDCVYILFENDFRKAYSFVEKIRGMKMEKIEIEIKRFFHSVLNVLKHCHDSDIICRLITFQSFLYFDKSPYPKAVEFEAAAFLSGVCHSLDINKKARTYCAPEIINGSNHYGSKADIYNVGFLLYILYNGCIRSSGKEVQQVLNNTVVRSIMDKMLQENPEERPSARDLLVHPWFFTEPYHVLFASTMSSPLLWLILDCFWKIHKIDAHTLDDVTSVHCLECYEENDFRTKVIPLFRDLQSREEIDGDLVEPASLIAASCTLLRIISTNHESSYWPIKLAMCLIKFSLRKLKEGSYLEKLAKMHMFVANCYQEVAFYDEACQQFAKSFDIYSELSNKNGCDESLYRLLECLLHWDKVEEFMAIVVEKVDGPVEMEDSELLDWQALFIEALRKRPYRPGLLKSRCLRLVERTDGFQATVSFCKGTSGGRSMETKFLGVVGRNRNILPPG